MRTKPFCPATFQGSHAVSCVTHSDESSRAGPLASKLQREMVLLLAWSPAILLQVAHPLVARGVADHSTFRSERCGWRRRLRDTVDAMLRLSFGTEREARVVLGRINAIHDRVHGRLPDAAGIFPAGTPYSAHDPALLTWVHATLVHMNLRVYQTFVGHLAPEDRDRYCAEATSIEGGLGIPAGWLPRSETELDRYMEGMLARGEIAVTNTARTLARAILYPHVPAVLAPATAVLRLITIGLLPPAIRAAYGFPWSARRDTALRGLAWLVRTLLRLTPPVLRHWPAARGAARRSGCRVAAERARKVAP
jgi:uncharacterized protein (DUF2236 family)